MRFIRAPLILTWQDGNARSEGITAVDLRAKQEFACIISSSQMPCFAEATQKRNMQKALELTAVFGPL
jgi:hypothetical protein